MVTHFAFGYSFGTRGLKLGGREVTRGSSEIAREAARKGVARERELPTPSPVVAHHLCDEDLAH